MAVYKIIAPITPWVDLNKTLLTYDLGICRNINLIVFLFIIMNKVDKEKQDLININYVKFI